MAAILFRCPTTNMLVQHWAADDEDAEQEYEGVTCLSCAGVHFVDRRGKVLGHDEEEP